MVASLQSKKEALEAKIRDKTSELKRLCIEEAELTGVLPAETPLEPGESPPQFRRRVGTTFTLPESLINRVRLKEDEGVAALELESKVQKGIAEAALVIANDCNASKSVRRRHRVLYQDSQRKLSDIETKLNNLRLNLPKQKKKPRPPSENENDVTDGANEDPAEQPRHSLLTISLSDRGTSALRHSQTYNSGFQKYDHPPLHYYPQRIVKSQLALPNLDYGRHSVMVPEHYHTLHGYSNYHPHDSGAWWARGNVEQWNHGYLPPPHVPQTPNDNFYNQDSVIPQSDRFRSLERNAPPAVPHDHERMSATLPRNSFNANSSSVLLPGQTYPENSLMRTQSLGNVDSSRIHPDRKTKEKEWYETSLDAALQPPRPTSTKPGSPNFIERAKTPSIPQYENPDNMKSQVASVSAVQFDTVVPYESPKNHTVVEAGKWQPYREVTKPFEMSDFYKYSTKFRKAQTQCNPPPPSPPPAHQEISSSQHKGIYKPLQPLECQPIMNNNVSSKMIPEGVPVENYNTDALSWYHDKSASSKPRSATLV